ncbi:hypothetical protein ACCO45_007040 [Purpureocillium lilacinum]|uniref:Uncharacterized protein n=1 Tax=Purpureocillium lilacinum TaxID=33203 RepID=A0ACC4DS88_PURLI
MDLLVEETARRAWAALALLGDAAFKLFDEGYGPCQPHAAARRHDDTHGNPDSTLPLPCGWTAPDCCAALRCTLTGGVQCNAGLQAAATPAQSDADCHASQIGQSRNSQARTRCRLSPFPRAFSTRVGALGAPATRPQEPELSAVPVPGCGTLHWQPPPPPPPPPPKARS